MTKYNTRNPLGSSAAKDLYDNAQNLDHFTNDTANEGWNDRFGISRLTWKGMEAQFARQLADEESRFVTQLTGQEGRFVTQLDSQEDRFYTFIRDSGYDVVGDYESGIQTITEYNQIIRYNGELYKLTSATSLPFTTSGTTSDTWDSTDGSHFVTVGDAALRQEITDSDGYKMVGQCNDYAALREIIPEKAGQELLLREYTYGTGYGGGKFVAVSGTGKEDNGINCVVNASWYWQRVGDPADFDITHFGALPGSSDSAVAIQRMHAWSQALPDPVLRVGVQLPSGTFSVSTLDLSGTSVTQFRLSGKLNTSFGYKVSTKLVLLGAGASIALTVQARYTEISNLWIYGQYDTDSVLRHFFKNTIIAGQYVRINNIFLSYMGRGFQLQDTLDCKFDQFYTSRTYDNIFRILASGTITGSWDHSTAVELSNFNIQYHLGASDQAGALFIPNCGQSLIRNGWIEHSTYPGNITLGQWSIQSLSMESCDNPLYAIYSKVINTLFSNPNNSGIDTSTDMTVNYQTGEYQTRALSSYERGSMELATHTLTMNGAVRQQWLASYKKISNITSSPIWVSVGHVYNPALANHVRFRIIGRSGYASGSSTSPISTEAIISIQNRGIINSTVTWECPLGGPISDVKYRQPYNADTYIYIQVPAYSVVGIFVESDGPTRTDTGTPVYLGWDMAIVSDITSISDINDAPSVSSIGTTTSGIVFDGENKDIRITGSTSYENEIIYMKLIYNGDTTYIPMQNNSATKLAKYSFGTLPAASANYYSIVYCDGFTCADGNTYHSQPVFSDGSNWRPMEAASTYLTGSA